MSRAWMPLYVGDYLRDTGHLTTLQHGAYLLLIMHYWQHGGLPNDGTHKRTIAGLTSKQWLRNKEAIASLFLPDWRHKRIDAEIAKAQELSEVRSVLGAIGGRKNRGRNNLLRHVERTNREAIAKAKGRTQSHKSYINGKSETSEPPPQEV